MAEEAVKNGEVQNGNSKAVTFSTLKPQLFVEAPKAAEAVQFYKAAFGAEEVNRVTDSKRKADQELPLVISAELKLGSTIFLVSDLSDDSITLNKTGANGFHLWLETDDIEAALANAVKAGAVSEGEISEGEGAGGGSRVGKVKDPFGVIWVISAPASPPVKKGDEAEA